MADTILIVDDSALNLQVIGLKLKTAGYNIVAAQSGKEALEIAKKEAFDLILLDIMMPDMDGIEVCRLLKEQELTQKIPIIFLTAKSDTIDIIAGFKAGCVDYVPKSFSTEELLARVRAHVELKKAREEIISLKGMLPICAHCKKIRDDRGYWENIENYLCTHTEVSFTHGICPECVHHLYAELADLNKSTQGVSKS